jgi:Ca2+:H+ antiporter
LACLPPIWVFLTGIVGVGVLADWIRATTEHLAQHTGPAVGGLLTVSLGSLAELILALFVLAQGQPEVVHAQITGSIIGTSLFGLGNRRRRRATRAANLQAGPVLADLQPIDPGVRQPA